MKYHSHCSKIRIFGPVTLVLGLVSSLQAATLTEVEPNYPCQNAQDLGALSIPAKVDGYKALDDVDFYKFTAPAGNRLRAVMIGNPPNSPQLLSTTVGLFSSSCQLQTFNPGIAGNAFLDFEVPADGQVVVGATACCDFSFTGSGILEGWYSLSIVNQTPPRAATAMDELYVGTAGDLANFSDDAVIRFLIRDAVTDAYQGPVVSCGQNPDQCVVGPEGLLIENNTMWIANPNAGLPKSGEVFEFGATDSVWSFKKAVVANTDANAPWGPHGMIKDGDIVYLVNKVSASGSPSPEGNVLAYNVTTESWLFPSMCRLFQAVFTQRA